MRITPVSMAYTRHNLRPQNQNVSFAGSKKTNDQNGKAAENKSEAAKEPVNYDMEEISDEEFYANWHQYTKDVKSGKITPKEPEPEKDEDYKSNFDKIMERGLY